MPDDGPLASLHGLEMHGYRAGGGSGGDRKRDGTMPGLPMTVEIAVLCGVCLIVGFLVGWKKSK